jgi:LmbE family N-acetylglucosaminyl deacetylase
VHGLWFTRGEHGQPSTDPPPEPCRLAELRERDLRETPPAVLQEHVLEQLRKYLPDVVLHSRTPSWM